MPPAPTDTLSGTFKSWYIAIPPVSRYLMTGMFVGTVAANFGLINPYYLVLDWNKVIGDFQIWRLVTNFFFLGRLGFPFLLSLMYVYKYSVMLEKEHFQGRTADYVYMLLCVGGALLVASWFFTFPILGPALIMSILLVWSRTITGMQVSIFFFPPIKSEYFPFALIAVNVLLGANVILDIAGLLAGHLYYFLKHIFPATHHMDPLQTPSERLVPFAPVRGQHTAVNAHEVWRRAREEQEAARPRHSWGSGHVLGRSD